MDLDDIITASLMSDSGMESALDSSLLANSYTTCIMKSEQGRTPARSPLVRVSSANDLESLFNDNSTSAPPASYLAAAAASGMIRRGGPHHRRMRSASSSSNNCGAAASPAWTAVASSRAGHDMMLTESLWMNDRYLADYDRPDDGYAARLPHACKSSNVHPPLAPHTLKWVDTLAVDGSRSTASEDHHSSAASPGGIHEVFRSTMTAAALPAAEMENELPPGHAPNSIFFDDLQVSSCRYSSWCQDRQQPQRWADQRQLQHGGSGVISSHSGMFPPYPSSSPYGQAGSFLSSSAAASPIRNRFAPHTAASSSAASPMIPAAQVELHGGGTNLRSGSRELDSASSFSGCSTPIGWPQRGELKSAELSGRLVLTASPQRCRPPSKTLSRRAAQLQRQQQASRSLQTSRELEGLPGNDTLRFESLQAAGLQQSCVDLDAANMRITEIDISCIDDGHCNVEYKITAVQFMEAYESDSTDNHLMKLPQNQEGRVPAHDLVSHNSMPPIHGAWLASGQVSSAEVMRPSTSESARTLTGPLLSSCGNLQVAAPPHKLLNCTTSSNSGSSFNSPSFLRDFEFELDSPSSMSSLQSVSSMAAGHIPNQAEDANASDDVVISGGPGIMTRKPSRLNPTCNDEKELHAGLSDHSNLFVCDGISLGETLVVGDAARKSKGRFRRAIGYVFGRRWMATYGRSNVDVDCKE